MNLPTTYPAPSVEGFFVAGAGGGLGDGRMPPGACYPREAEDVLNEVEYIFDTRYTVSGIREFPALKRRLEEMARRRVDAFARLAERYRPDVGFVAFMAPKVLQYLAMQEIENTRIALYDGIPLTGQQQGISEFYRQFDAHLKRLVDTVRPESIVLVSDHGQAVRTHDVDVGAFLRSHGWQEERSRRAITLQGRVRRAVKNVVPRKALSKLSKRPAIRAASGAQSRVDFRKSHAFGLRYVPGIYINDERFGAVVQGERERNGLVDALIGSLNADDTARRHGIRARPFRRDACASREIDALLPDVWLEMPEGYMMDYGVGNSASSLEALVEDNPAYGKPIDFREVTRDQWTGMKGHTPLLAVHGGESVIDHGELIGDLTDAYRVILGVLDATPSNRE